MNHSVYFTIESEGLSLVRDNLLPQWKLASKDIMEIQNGH